MPYQGKMQQQAPEEHKKARPEEQFVPEQRTFGMPNSLMQAVPMAQPGTPNSVMREMDADDSGALFRGRGFDPSIGAHELSHTVRREPANGPVRQTVPSGTIQRAGGVDDEEPPVNFFFGSQSEEPAFNGRKFVIENLDLLNQVKKPFLGSDFQIGINALRSKIDATINPQEKKRLTGILNEAHDVRDKLFQIEQFLMAANNNDDFNRVNLEACANELERIQSIAAELNAAVAAPAPAPAAVAAAAAAPAPAAAAAAAPAPAAAAAADPEAENMLTDFEKEANAGDSFSHPVSEKELSEAGKAQDKAHRKDQFLSFLHLKKKK